MSALEDADAAGETDALIEELAAAAAALERARDHVEAVGEAELDELAAAHDELTDLFDRYEKRVTGDGDFQTFIEFQGKVASFTENLPSDLRHHGVFDDVDDLLQQRRLTESDWERVRETLAPVRDDVARLDDRAEARERYAAARVAVECHLSTVEDRIDDLERLQRLGNADLEAPTERLREPIETYDQRVREAFREFRSEASARDVLDLIATTEAYPLIDFRPPPEDLRAFVERHEAGTETVARLLEFSEYSRSKLGHYVEDPDALKRAVGSHQTYVRRLDADPMTVEWPPPDADTLQYRCRELTSVVARFAGDDVLVALRGVRALPRETGYDRLRESARARDRLGPEERERLASGAVEEELTATRAARDRLEEALSEYPST
jgi:hypothetical protein